MDKTFKKLSDISKTKSFVWNHFGNIYNQDGSLFQKDKYFCYHCFVKCKGLVDAEKTKGEEVEKLIKKNIHSYKSGVSTSNHADHLRLVHDIKPSTAEAPKKSNILLYIEN